MIFEKLALKISLKITINFKKMKKRSKIIVSVLFLGAFIFAGAYGIKSVFAFYGNGSDFHNQMAQKFSQRFNLDQKEVESFLNENFQERQKERQTYQENRLGQLVLDGKITQEQKEVILKKMEEMKKESETIANLSWEEQKIAREKHQAEMESWAKKNGIGLDQIMPMFGGFGRGMGRHLNQ